MTSGDTGQKSVSPVGWVMLAGLAAIWGTAFPATRVALFELSVLQLIAARLGLAAILMWIYVRARGHVLPRGWGVWGAFLVMGALNNAFPFALIAWGQTHIESGLAAILTSTTAIFAVVLAAVLFRDERMTARKAIGVCVGFAGVVTAIGPETLTRFDPRSIAQLAVLAGALCFALAAIWAKRHLVGLAPPVAALGMLSAGAVLLLPAALLLDGLPELPLALPTVSALLYSVLIATVCAFFLYYHLLSTVGAGNASLVTFLIPPFAIAGSAVMLGEKLPPNAYAGFAIIILGLLFLDGRLGRRARGSA